MKINNEEKGNTMREDEAKGGKTRREREDKVDERTHSRLQKVRRENVKWKKKK